MDLTVTASRLPSLGETVIGNTFSAAPGGKGANQAVGAARLGAQVTMVGKVGEDAFGDALLASAEESGVDVSFVRRVSGVPSAIGNVQLQQTAQGADNRIVVVPGANMELNDDDVAFLKERICEYDMVILQHEIPSHVNQRVAEYARAAGVPVMLNPAPYAEVSDELMVCLSYISPNEHEAAAMTGIVPDGEQTVRQAAERLQKRGVSHVLITLGERGCAYCDGETVLFSGSEPSGAVVDTTAAGDSFVAAFCTATAAGIDRIAALRFANCTAGITVSRAGAQPSLPALAEVLRVMRDKGYETANFTVLQ